MKKGKVIIISGASGVGKGSVLKEMLRRCPELRFSVSATTRPPRPGERDGVDYTFVSKKCFEKMIAEDAFVEYDNHAKNYYGTPRKQLEEKRALGHVILDIEPAGAKQVIEKVPDVVLVFIMPPSMEELERRLRGRGDTPEDQIRLRLRRAVWEMDQRSWYQHVVVNDNVSRCAGEILDIIAHS